MNRDTSPRGFENDVLQRRLDFDGPGPEVAEEIAADDTLVLDLDGYEGPLHVLLALARQQKVDLLKISITRLAEQYLTFIQEARRLRFSLAADYLVMASWLAYLKSRLLLPQAERKQTNEPQPEELAAALAFRLKKLEAMRKSVEALTSRPQLKRDVFARGDPEARLIIPSSRIEANVFDLMSAYVTQRRREIERHYDPTRRIEAYSLEDARDNLRAQLPKLSNWTALEDVAPQPYGAGGPRRVSYVASTLSASLELAKEGHLQLQQLATFETLYMRKRQPISGDRT
ncbi:segregation and condensation protein A [Asticcacaulis benevestitus]|uniref:Segregation and condensation protein A n=1 Tax=Asticcacaulis benevestitus DSM 16100 = ATCC BAA-896 TaxID=1121022 RepID=V4PJ24_9CAUL|nr:ScpA family protein [Asticcacaulis benevestitus]ESQ93962.1 chromosome segregation protein ScpA [Asticcacaulis benevestitus DSM 16100 = ATCC BAA-896]